MGLKRIKDEHQVMIMDIMITQEDLKVTFQLMRYSICSLGVVFLVEMFIFEEVIGGVRLMCIDKMLKTKKQLVDTVFYYK